MSTSAFGIEHGQISKAGPHPGGKFTDTATAKDKKHAQRRFAGVVGMGGLSGGLIGGAFGGKPGLRSKQGKAGAALGAATIATHAVGTTRDIKRGVIADPYKVSKGGINPVSGAGKGTKIGPLAMRMHAERAARGGRLLPKSQTKFTGPSSRINPNTKPEASFPASYLQRRK
jgi:hypothetical protein